MAEIIKFPTPAERNEEVQEIYKEAEKEREKLKEETAGGKASDFGVLGRAGKGTQARRKGACGEA